MRKSLDRHGKGKAMESQKDEVKKGVNVITGLSEDSTTGIQ